MCSGTLDPFAEILWREWEDFSTQPDAQGLEAGDGPQFQFTLMSYNILAQDLMQQSSELYLHCHPDILNWNYRFANLMQEFQHWDPDVSEEGDAPFCIGAENPDCFLMLRENEFHSYSGDGSSSRQAEIIFGSMDDR